MKKIISFLSSIILFTLAIGVLTHPRTLAQIHQSDQESSTENTQEIEQETQNPQEIQPTQEQEEQQLERTLNIEEKNPDAPKIEEVPALGDGDNLPTPPPAEEVEIKFPE